MKRALIFSSLFLAMVAGWGAQTLWAKHLEEANRTFELRIYSVLPGRMDAMNARFKNHTNGLLTKHGMTLIGFWQPQGDDAGKKLYYLVAHKNRKAADASWKAFIADPEWKKVQTASEADGKIVEKVDRVWLDPTEYSMMK